MIVNDLLLEELDEKLLFKIKQQCQPFLSAFASTPLYRGVDDADPDKITFTKHPKNRESVDSTVQGQLIFNSLIYEAFGIKDVRTKTLFGSPSFSQARFYGPVFYCFPSGNIKFLTSVKIKDSYSDDYVIHGDIRKILEMPKSVFSDFFLDVSNKVGTSSKWLYDENYPKYKAFITKQLKNINEDRDSELTFDDIKNALKVVGTSLYSTNLASTYIKNEVLVYESSGYYLVPYELVKRSPNEKLADSYKSLLERINQS